MKIIDYIREIYITEHYTNNVGETTHIDLPVGVYSLEFLGKPPTPFICKSSTCYVNFNIAVKNGLKYYLPIDALNEQGI